MAIYKNFAEVYDIFMADIPYQKWAIYIEKIFEKFNYKPKSIVELGCGTGNFTTILSKNGYQITGIDSSCEMLAKAKEKSILQNLNILYLNQDMRKFELHNPVNCILSVCDSINYILEENDLLKVFKLVNTYLNSNGLFIFDINSIYKFESILSNNTFSETTESSAYTLENYYDKEEMINEYYTNFFIKDKNTSLYNRFEEIHYEKAYSIEKIKELLKKSGLNILGIYDELTFNIPNEKSQRIFFVAHKD